MNEHNEPETTEERIALLAPLGIRIHAQYIQPAPAERFVSGHSPRPDAPPTSMFHYRVTLSREDGRTLTTDYRMGLGHVNYSKSSEGDRSARSVTLEKLWRGDALTFPATRATRTPPTLLGVLHSLVSDADADGFSFTEWAENFGYDTDSRKAEAIYHACRKIAEDLRRLLTRDELAKVSHAVQGY